MTARFTPDGGSGGGSSTINVKATQAPAVVVSQTSSGTVTPSQKVGVAVSQAPATLLTTETPGVALTQSVSGTVTQAQAAGVSQVTSMSLPGTPQNAGAKIVQITYNLTQTNGATGATSTGSWSNPTNAKGLHDGVNAANANSVTAAASGALTLTYGAQPNKTPLTITQVQLKGYWGNTAGAVGPCTYLIEYSVNGGTSWTTLQTGSASVASGTPTTTTDITTPIAGSWTAVAAVQVRCTYTGASSATVSSMVVDAFELIVTANTTQTP